MRYLIGLDLGTGGVKGILYNEKGVIKHTAFVEYPLYCTQPKWAEQNPEDWWNACVKVLQDLAASAEGEIAGIGLSGQMHGLVLLDGTGTPVRNSIIWCDLRSTPQCHEIEHKTNGRLSEMTSNRAIECFTTTKLLWVKQNEPELYDKAQHMLLPKDYINYKLTGNFTTDVSDASGTLLFDVANRRWNGEILELLGINSALLPNVFESADICGRVSVTAAKLTGIKEGTSVAAGAGDQAAAGLGNGIIHGGSVSCNIGTSGVVFAANDFPVCDPKGRIQTFCHAVRNKWFAMGVTQGAGLSMKWFKDNFYSEYSPSEVYGVLNSDASKIAATSEGLIFLPYLMGERAPHLDPDAKGVFIGITGRHTRAHFARAVMEGISFSLNDCFELIKSLGIKADKVVYSGGGAKSELWKTMLTDIFGRQAYVAQSAEAGCLGAAILAGTAAGVFTDEEAASKIFVKHCEQYTPDTVKFDTYSKAYRLYREAYKALKNYFKMS